MKEFFARLNPTERRFVVGVGVVFFLVINIVWVWPHFGDWSQTRTHMDEASRKEILFQGGINLIPGLQKEIERYQKQGQLVPPADQAVSFVRLIQNQAAQSGVIPESMNPVRQSGVSSNAYFVEQGENMRLQSSEKQLVNFLYNLGAGSNSLIRVKALSVQPDPAHQRLITQVTLVASYQKKNIGPAPAATTAAKRPAATSTASNAPAGKPATTPAKQPSTGLTPHGATNRAAPAPVTGPKPLSPKK